MAQTVANLADVMKEVWTSDRLEKQFYDEQRLLARLKRTSKFTHGKKAVVPIHKGRSGGLTTLGSAGGALNGADEQKVDRAEYTVPYNYHEIEIQIAAINEATGNGFSVGSALDLEVTGAVSDIQSNITRQFLGNNDGIIAAADTGGAATTVELTTTGYGFDAIARGWLYPGLKVDIGTAGDSDTIVAGSEIVSVKEDATDPDITISDSVSTVAGTHFVSLAQARSRTTGASLESDGLRNMAGSTTGASGGLDPDTAGEEFWKPAHVDTTTTVLSLNLLLTMQRKIGARGGRNPWLVASLYQQSNLYELLQSQVRFDRDQVEAGNDVPKWNGIMLDYMPEVPDREVYMLTLEDLAIVTGAKIKSPTWVSALQGTNQGMTHKQGFTSFVDTLVYPVGLAMSRRNRLAAAIGLTA